MKSILNWRLLIWTPILTVGYVIFSKIGFQLAFLNSQVSPVWPPEGMGLTALLFLGKTSVPGIFLGAFTANFLNNPHLPTAFFIAVGNTLSSSVNYYLLYRLTGQKNPLYSTKGLLYFLTVCTVPGSALSAGIGVTSLLYWGFLPSEKYWNVLFTWFSGELQGFLIVAPLLFVWINPKERFLGDWKKKIELIFWCAVIYVSGRIAFSDVLPLLFLPIPFVIVASLRFQQFGATLASAILAFTAVTQTVAESGVFAMKQAGTLSVNDSLIYLDAFLFSINGISYFLVTVSRERERAQTQAMESLETINRLKEITNEELERKVNERTQVIEMQKQEIDKQLDVAKRIQESLFPNKMTSPDPIEIAFHNVPMMKVGGDLFDIKWSPESNSLAVFICDVSGHGIPAAFLSALVKMSLDHWNREPSSLTKSLEHIRTQITPNLKDHFVTASMVFIDTKQGKLRFARAGHFPLYIIRESGSLVTLKPMGRIITPFFPTLSEEENFELKKGDLIILLTDGLTEARKPDAIEMFGEERLLNLISARRNEPLANVIDFVFDTILDHSGGMEMIQDDLTLVLLRYRGN
ncbi:SpoIIE family protein phosphatase [Leptospira ilyithenensis]|uniref:Serine/threonine protein phosphatase n=1 Tax=Leptospira ilyithenensis TaxID=2484901 RepID=A0A4R9LJD1_9LEPT|nr:SpoIIE family protein phosphatase [Leptospira ilyithenensis]TGN06986.1 serine/threonine protein phosphatase [Leptospira ilyithenensis]